MLEHILSVRNRSWAWFKERAHSKHALFWLLFLAFIEATISPIIPETLLVAMLLAGAERWKYYAFLTTLASVAGGIFGYFLGYGFYGVVGKWVIDLYGLAPYVGEARDLFSASIFITMVFATFTLLPDKIFVFLAGFLGVDFIPYLLGYIVGRSARFFGVAYVVKRWGPATLAAAEKYLLWTTLAILVLACVLVLELLHITNLTAYIQSLF